MVTLNNYILSDKCNAENLKILTPDSKKECDSYDRSQIFINTTEKKFIISKKLDDYYNAIMNVRLNFYSIEVIERINDLLNYNYPFLYDYIDIDELSRHFIDDTSNWMNSKTGNNLIEKFSIELSKYHKDNHFEKLNQLHLAVTKELLDDKYGE